MGYSPWGCKESDTTEQLSVHLFLKKTYVKLMPWLLTGGTTLRAF